MEITQQANGTFKCGGKGAEASLAYFSNSQKPMGLEWSEPGQHRGDKVSNVTGTREPTDL